MRLWGVVMAGDGCGGGGVISDTVVARSLDDGSEILLCHTVRWRVVIGLCLVDLICFNDV